MNKYGVCNYDFNIINPKVENLEGFDTFEEAFGAYMKRMMSDDHYPYTWDKSLWYVLIEGDRIIQFEQLNTNTKTRTVEI